jgi:hypothetical protein
MSILFERTQQTTDKDDAVLKETLSEESGGKMFHILWE